MTIRTKIFKILLIFLIFNSCGFKNLAKRYRNYFNTKTFNTSTNPQLFVEVDLHSVLIKEDPAKEVKFNLLSLSDRGQEAYINSANAKSTSSAMLSEILNTNFAFSKEEKSQIKIIPKTIKKTLIFTVDRKQYVNNPGTGVTTFNTIGDRISFLELSVEIPEGINAIFNSWDKYVTDKVTLNLGKVSSAQNWNASLSVSAKGTSETSLTGSNTNENFSSDKGTNTITMINTGDGSSNTTKDENELLLTGKGTNGKSNTLKANAELGASGTIGYSDKYETSLDLISQILKLSGTLKENMILLRQEGGPGIDLSGNIVVSVEYTITDDWAAPVEFIKIKNLYATGGKPNPLDEINSSFLTVIFPDISQNVTGQMNYTFLYRQVNKGNRHIPESRHKVTYRYGNVPYSENAKTGKKAINLVKKEDIRPKSYVITRGGAACDKVAYNKTVMNFETIAEATIFLAYIKDLVRNKANLDLLTINTGVLTSSDAANLKIITEQL